MNKQEFINEMRIALTGHMDVASVNDNIRYYEDYITSAIRQGKSEEDVINDLGDANALAINLIDAYERTNKANSNSSNSSYTNESDTRESSADSSEKKVSFFIKVISFFISHPLLSIGIIIGLILILVILAIWLALSILTHFWPIILIIIIALIVGFLVLQLIKLINKK